MDWEQSVANKINEVYYGIVDYYVILNGEPMVHNQKQLRYNIRNEWFKIGNRYFSDAGLECEILTLLLMIPKVFLQSRYMVLES